MKIIEIIIVLIVFLVAVSELLKTIDCNMTHVHRSHHISLLGGNMAVSFMLISSILVNPLIKGSLVFILTFSFVTVLTVAHLRAERKGVADEYISFKDSVLVVFIKLKDLLLIFKKQTK